MERVLCVPLFQYVGGQPRQIEAFIFFELHILLFSIVVFMGWQNPIRPDSAGTAPNAELLPVFVVFGSAGIRCVPPVSCGKPAADFTNMQSYEKI